MKAYLANPVNDTQREFVKLCQQGGGKNGGPIASKVLDLIRSSGRRLNALAYKEMAEHFAAYPTANSWHVCFALGLCWGHLAKQDVEFTGHVVGALSEWNDDDLSAACSFHLERGPDPIRQSLAGAHILFSKVLLPPPPLPFSLDRLGRAQERWLTPILNPAERPPYIGSWNATAMFMMALFAQPELAMTQRTQEPILPPGGPIFNGLKILHQAGVLACAPSGSELDDEAFEPGALYENNQLLVDLLNGLKEEWCLVDVHSGVYMLGTRHPHSNSWV